MEWRRLFLPRHQSLSCGAQASAAVVAGEISALLTARSFRDSVKRAEQFIRANAVGASSVLEMYQSVAAAGPHGQRLYLSDAASALVEASTRADLPDGALLLIDHLIGTPMLPRPLAIPCGHLMAKLLSLGRRADARRVFETLDDRKRNQAITTVWRAGRAADAVKVFGEMAGTAAAPIHSRYPYYPMNMMNECLKKGDLEAASELRTRMVQAGMQLPREQRQMLQMLEKAWAHRPNNIKGNMLIQISIMADGIDDAIRWLRQMGQDGMAPPNAHSYNLLLAALWKAGRGDDAVKMFGEMADMSLAPNKFTYTVMINGHLKRLSPVLASKKNESGDLDAALQLRARMVQEGFKPDEFTNNLLMAELCLAERLGDVTDLFHQSAKDGVAVTYNDCITLLKELCKIQKVSFAEKVLQTFVEAWFIPTTEMYCSKGKRKRMREMYNILIDGYCKINELEGAFSLCRQMKSHGRVLPNEATYDALLLAVRNNTSIVYWEDVVELFEKNGVSADALNSSSSAKYGFKNRNDALNSNSSATYGFKYRNSLVRVFNKLVSKLF